MFSRQCILIIWNVAFLRLWLLFVCLFAYARLSIINHQWPIIIIIKRTFSFLYNNVNKFGNYFDKTSWLWWISFFLWFYFFLFHCHRFFSAFDYLYEQTHIKCVYMSILLIIWWWWWWWWWRYCWWLLVTWLAQYLQNKILQTNISNDFFFFGLV